MNRLLASFLFICTFLLSPSCSRSETEEIYVKKEIDYYGLEKVLNQNLQSLRQLVELKKSNKQLFSVNSSEDKTLLFFLGEEQPVALHKIITSTPVLYPCFSLTSVEDDYYWTLSNDFITDSKGGRISVTNDDLPSIHYQDDQWNLLIKDSSIVVENTRLSYGYPAVDRMDEVNAYISFPSHYQLSFPLSGFTTPRVPNKAFYKDIFMDAGIGLTSRKSLAAANLLKYSLEGMSFSRNDATSEEKRLQNEIIAGSAEDTNGRLLYPDGQPRYKVLFVNGGNSFEHGKSLDEASLNNMRLFFHKGGSYVGTCAGAFFAAKGNGSHEELPFYLSLWPSRAVQTGIYNSQTGFFIEKGSPLLDFSDFGGDMYVEDVRHNGGCYPFNIPQGTEVLARYDYPINTRVHMLPSAWSYKEYSQTGRVIMVGSHPEEAASGEKRDFTASVIQYAVDGLGETVIKGFLQKGKPRHMDRNTEDNQPSFTKIGDKQCHHFVVYIPDKANNISISVGSENNCDLVLRMTRDTFAFPDNAEYASSATGAKQQLTFNTLEEGLWYISVQCLTTPTVEQTDYGQTYTGRIDVLNGIPYSIEVSWE